MALSLDKIKQDFARNKKRSVMLGMLSVALLGFIAKAYFEMSPRNAVASDALSPQLVVPEEPAMSAETDARIRQSKELWNTLRTVDPKQMPPKDTFTFLSSYYTPDPSRIHNTPAVDLGANQTTTTATPINSQELERTRLKEKIQAEAKKLVITSVVVGGHNSQPVAIIAGSIVTVGDSVSGFKIIAITKDHGIDFTKEGVTVTVDIAGANSAPDNRRGQPAADDQTR